MSGLSSDINSFVEIVDLVNFCCSVHEIFVLQSSIVNIFAYLYLRPYRECTICDETYAVATYVKKFILLCV